MSTPTTSRQRLRIAVTRALPDPVIQMIRSRHDVWVNPDDRTLTPDEFQAVAAKADALIVTAFNRCDAEAIAKFPPSLRILSTYSVGIEHIDLDAAKAQRVPVADRGQGVLRGERAAAAVREDARVGPARAAHEASAGCAGR